MIGLFFKLLAFFIDQTHRNQMTALQLMANYQFDQRLFLQTWFFLLESETQAGFDGRGFFKLELTKLMDFLQCSEINC